MNRKTQNILIFGGVGAVAFAALWSQGKLERFGLRAASFPFPGIKRFLAPVPRTPPVNGGRVAAIKAKMAAALEGNNVELYELYRLELENVQEGITA